MTKQEKTAPNYRTLNHKWTYSIDPAHHTKLCLQTANVQ